VGVVGVWCRVASLHGFCQSADMVDRIASKAFGHGLGTDLHVTDLPAHLFTEREPGDRFLANSCGNPMRQIGRPGVKAATRLLHRLARGTRFQGQTDGLAVDDSDTRALLPESGHAAPLLSCLTARTSKVVGRERPAAVGSCVHYASDATPTSSARKRITGSGWHRDPYEREPGGLWRESAGRLAPAIHLRCESGMGLVLTPFRSLFQQPRS
jgi:hypothetical protein